jgi:hypothetical protein
MLRIQLVYGSHSSNFTQNLQRNYRAYDATEKIERSPQSPQQEASVLSAPGHCVSRVSAVAKFPAKDTHKMNA